MGTRLRVRVAAADRSRALRALEAATREIEETERLLSSWDPDTPLSALNRAPVGAPVHVGGALFEALAEAQGWSRRTGGAFEPAVGALLDVWGVRGWEGEEGTMPDGAAARPGRGASAVPDEAEVQAARAATGPGAFALDDRAGTVTRRHAAARIDTGAFGKGLALRRAAGALRGLGVREARLDIGGQHLLLSGVPDSGRVLEVADPVDRSRCVARLRVANASVATSGHSERPGHIVDPRSGRPTSAWGSVTVVAVDPVEADVLSTALYVMGPAEGLAWAERHGVAALFAVREGPDVRTLATPRAAAHLAGACPGVDPSTMRP